MRTAQLSLCHGPAAGFNRELFAVQASQSRPLSWTSTQSRQVVALVYSTARASLRSGQNLLGHTRARSATGTARTVGP